MPGVVPSRTVDLDAILSPLLADDFFTEHWERRPLHIRRGDAGFYGGVLSTPDLERVISSADLRFPAIQLARHGGYLPPEVYTTSIKHGTEVWSGVPDVEKVRAEYRSGATVVLPAFHRAWPPLRALCRNLEDRLSHAVHANAYLTAADTTGFLPHYDAHEVFVLQIGGSKRWRIHEPPVALPHRTQTFSRPGFHLPPLLGEFELQAGDLLYLPRGYVHAATTSASFSAHVTLGVTVYTWIELLSELVQAGRDIPALRRALPVGFARDDAPRGALEDALAEGLRELARDGLREDVADRFLERVRAARMRADAPFRADVVVIGPRTELAPPARDRYAIRAEGDALTLVHGGRTVRLPATVRATLDAICARASFRVADLPGGDEDATLALVELLEGEGFLAVVRRV